MTSSKHSVTATNEIRVAIIGAGIRSASYLTNIPEYVRPRIRLVGVADPRQDKRRMLIDRFAKSGGPAEFDSGDQLLENTSFDALIIGSYNNTHADFAIKAIGSGASILLEKPVATTVEQCHRLWKSSQSADNKKVFVGFVLRYAPFFQRLKQLLREHAVGQVLAIDADENIAQAVTSCFFRDWRRDDELSGGFMVEKCCHDFDILHWLTGRKVVRVFSLAKRTHFVSRPREEQHRRFDADVIRKIALDYGDIHVKQFFENTSDESIYEAKSDVPDHQAVMLEFDDGTLVNFMACHGQPRSTRRLRIFGSNGSIEGDVARGKIMHDIPFDEHRGAHTHTISIDSDSSGHNGADSIINDAFWGAAAGGKISNLAGIREGIDAVLVGIAAERSKHSGLPVELEPLRQEVFGSRPATGPGAAV